jgi:hypothetical protein
MRENARVAWHETPEPWIVEAELIHRANLPLNLSHNGQHPFWEKLTALRKCAKAAAKPASIAQ